MTCVVDLELLAALRTPEGSTALAAAAEVAGGDPLAAASALRARGVAPGLAAAALTQAELRRRAAAKFGAGRRARCSSPGPGWSRPPGRWSPTGGRRGCAPRA